MDKNTLLKFHMDCNPNYMFGHAIVAGKLASKELQTYEEYVSACKKQGIDYYSQECYDAFMNK